MDDNVVILPVATRLSIPTERVLSEAIKSNLDEVVVLGFDQDGGFYFASSKADRTAVLWLVELAKKSLLAVGDDD